MTLWKCCTQYASKFGKLSSSHRTAKSQFQFQSQRKAMTKNVQTMAQLQASHTLATATAAKSLQSCPTLCDPIDGSAPGSPVPGILQARTLKWVAIPFSNAWKWNVKVKSLSRVWPSATPWTAAFQAPPSMGFSRQEYWSGVPLPSPFLKTSDNYFCFIPEQLWCLKLPPLLSLNSCSENLQAMRNQYTICYGKQQKKSYYSFLQFCKNDFVS